MVLISTVELDHKGWTSLHLTASYVLFAICLVCKNKLKLVMDAPNKVSKSNIPSRYLIENNS